MNTRPVTFKDGTRVKLAAYTDAFMQGDVYGKVIRTVQRPAYEVCHVKMDKSGRVLKLLVGALTEVS